MMAACGAVWAGPAAAAGRQGAAARPDPDERRHARGHAAPDVGRGTIAKTTTRALVTYITRASTVQYVRTRVQRWSSVATPQHATFHTPTRALLEGSAGTRSAPRTAGVQLTCSAL